MKNLVIVVFIMFSLFSLQTQSIVRVFISLAKSKQKMIPFMFLSFISCKQITATSNTTQLLKEKFYSTWHLTFLS